MGTSVAGVHRAAGMSIGVAGPQAGRREAEPLQEPGSVIFVTADPSVEALGQPLAFKVILYSYFASKQDSVAKVLPTQAWGYVPPAHSGAFSYVPLGKQPVLGAALWHHIGGDQRPGCSCSITHQIRARTAPGFYCPHHII